MSHATIAQWEAGITRPKAARMRHVAMVLGLQLEDLIPKAA